MAQPMTAHLSFVYLVDNIPDWQREINTLSYRASVKNTEFQAEYTRLVSQIRPKRKKTPSLASIHTLDDNEQPTDAPSPAGVPSSDNDLPSPLDRVEIDPFEAGNRYLYAQARRKRKPGTSIRSGASGPQKFRNKNQVVVYYDGFLQEHLDALVKQIGYGRNNLRKGKNALAAAQGFQLPRLARAAARDYSSVEDIRSTMGSRSTSSLLSGRKIELSVGQDVADHETTFLQVDKELESVQSICETAAHQFLRDGDCQAEMNTIKQKLKDLHARAGTTAEALRKVEAEQLSKTSKVERGSCAASDNSHHSDSDATLSTKPSLDFLHTPKLTAQNPLAINNTLDDMKSRGAFLSAPETPFEANTAPIVADDIEVDDESDPEDIVVDITSYRLANPRRARV